jgi:hypothetical protein
MPSARKQKPTIGWIAEVGCLRFDLSFPYRASPPHCSALLQQQQTQALNWTLWRMGLFL